MLILSWDTYWAIEQIVDFDVPLFLIRKPYGLIVGMVYGRSTLILIDKKLIKNYLLNLGLVSFMALGHKININFMACR